jgi:hypothetical protein
MSQQPFSHHGAAPQQGEGGSFERRYAAAGPGGPIRNHFFDFITGKIEKMKVQKCKI